MTVAAVEAPATPSIPHQYPKRFGHVRSAQRAWIAAHHGEGFGSSGMLQSSVRDSQPKLSPLQRSLPRPRQSRRSAGCVIEHGVESKCTRRTTGKPPPCSARGKGPIRSVAQPQAPRLEHRLSECLERKMQLANTFEATPPHVPGVTRHTLRTRHPIPPIAAFARRLGEAAHDGVSVRQRAKSLSDLLRLKGTSKRAGYSMRRTAAAAVRSSAIPIIIGDIDNERKCKQRAHRCLAHADGDLGAGNGTRLDRTQRTGDAGLCEADGAGIVCLPCGLAQFDRTSYAGSCEQHRSFGAPSAYIASLYWCSFVLKTFAACEFTAAPAGNILKPPLYQRRALIHKRASHRVTVETNPASSEMELCVSPHCRPPGPKPRQAMVPVPGST